MPGNLIPAPAKFPSRVHEAGRFLAMARDSCTCARKFRLCRGAERPMPRGVVHAIYPNHATVCGAALLSWRNCHCVKRSAATGLNAPIAIRGGCLRIHPLGRSEQFPILRMLSASQKFCCMAVPVTVSVLAFLLEFFFSQKPFSLSCAPACKRFRCPLRHCDRL